MLAVRKLISVILIPTFVTSVLILDGLDNKLYASSSCSHLLEIRPKYNEDVASPQEAEALLSLMAQVPEKFPNLPWPMGEGLDALIYHKGPFWGFYRCVSCTLNFEALINISGGQYMVYGTPDTARMAAVHELGHVSYMERFIKEFLPNLSDDDRAALIDNAKSAMHLLTKYMQNPSREGIENSPLAKELFPNHPKLQSLHNLSLPFQELYADLLQGIFYDNLNSFTDQLESSELRHLSGVKNSQETLSRHYKMMIDNRDFKSNSTWEEEIQTVGQTWYPITDHGYFRPTRTFIGSQIGRIQMKSQSENLLKCVLEGSIELLHQLDPQISLSDRYLQGINMYMIKKLKECPGIW